MQSDLKTWQFWIDRGGTFTDILGVTCEGELKVAKLLSENSQQYPDAAIAGIRQILGLSEGQKISKNQISCVKMGTTVATNALLEHRGAKVVLLITKGFADLPSIGYQNRPDIFALNIKKPKPLYSKCIEIDERLAANGKVIKPLNQANLKQQLCQAIEQGYESIAIALLHSYLNPVHELQLEKMVRELGFNHISVSHKLSPLPRLVPRLDTTLIDAYLTPVLTRYVDQVAKALDDTKLLFMQSNGGLIAAEQFSGCNSILSGPAAGVVGMVETAKQHGFEKIIGFDMGGTSSDIYLYKGRYQQTLNTEIAGVRVRAPMLDIHTVAAGGGSCLVYKDQRFQVGPTSAGADPGPACYARGGPLTVTDIQVLLGRIRPECFPKVFSENSDQALNKKLVITAFKALAIQINSDNSTAWSIEKIAEGFLEIAIANMANAIKDVTTAKGLDAEDFVLNCFGGAAGQHACMVAEQLNIKQLLIHPLASLLSAYGMGLADTVIIVQQSITRQLSPKALQDILPLIENLSINALAKMKEQGIDSASLTSQLSLRYKGSDNCIELDIASNLHSNATDSAKLIDTFLQALTFEFSKQHKELFGFFEQDKTIIIDKITLEARFKPEPLILNSVLPGKPLASKGLERDWVYFNGGYQEIDFHPWASLQVGKKYQGPLVIFSDSTSLVVECAWFAEIKTDGTILLQHQTTTEQNLSSKQSPSQKPNIKQEQLNFDPVRLELFSNLFQTIADQMGRVLARTAHSVNIKERFDFSCAIFDAKGNLIANAPHMPVHLGSMGESIIAVLKQAKAMQDGDVYLINDPYQGGTHLPDLTLVTPVFHKGQVIYLLGSRGHHADVGGIAPGSMPSNSTSIHEEGCLFKCFKLLDRGKFQEQNLRTLLLTGEYPARNPDQNIADLKAQVAANNKGRQELDKAFNHYGRDRVLNYMQFVQDNAEQILRRVISNLSSGNYCYKMDNGAEIVVAITINAARRSACIDFTGTSGQLNNNFNAPSAICRAAVLYVFRCLIDENIPLNGGCLRPLEILIPSNSMLNPSFPAAVVAGNVETSQVVTDALFCALEVMAGSQGTMNNLTFGNQHFQYYETIAGGAGATKDCNGASGVQTHMTNSRITDPEILESRYPVRLTQYEYRTSSGGLGLHSGGDGLLREIQFLEPMTVNILSGNRHHSPPGISGGLAGKSGQNQLFKVTGEKIELSATCQINVATDDKLRIKTPGGGGFGHSIE